MYVKLAGTYVHTISPKGALHINFNKYAKTKQKEKTSHSKTENDLSQLLRISYV